MARGGLNSLPTASAWRRGPDLLAHRSQEVTAETDQRAIRRQPGWQGAEAEGHLEGMAVRRRGGVGAPVPGG